MVGLAPAGDGWEVVLDGGMLLRARAVVVATGGLSVPNTGSDGAGLRLLESLGHTVHPTYPALTPLTTGVARWTELSGVSLDAQLSAPPETPSYSPATGISLYPSRVQRSCRAQYFPSLHAAAPGRASGNSRALGSVDAGRLGAGVQRRRAATQVATVIRRQLPERLAMALLEEAGVPADRTLAQLRREERESLLTALTALPLPVSGDEGYRKAEVTGGGVALSEIDPVTMESRRSPGLFLCGEVLDAFGPIGGFNFHWAWATGRAAGLGVRRRLASSTGEIMAMLPDLSRRLAVLDEARESFLDADSLLQRITAFVPPRRRASWSMLDVAEHLVLAEEKSLLGMLKGPPPGTTVTPVARIRMALVLLVMKSALRVKVPVARVLPTGSVALAELESALDGGAARAGGLSRVDH